MFYLAFSQRLAPGTNYKLQELRDVLDNSIRSARYHWRKLTNSINHATAALQRQNDHGMEGQNEIHLKRTDEF